MNRMNSHNLFAALVLIAMLHFVSQSIVTAQEPDAGGNLSVEQAQLADRYERLEMVAARLAELSAATDPRRAQRLRDAIARSREQDVGVRFEAIVDLLENERLAAASRNQQDLQGELASLLEFLLKDSRDSQIESEQRRIRKYLREVGRLIRWQKGIRARTEGGDEQDSLERDQSEAAKETAELGGQIDETENEGNEKEAGESAEAGQSDGEPSDGEQQPSEGKPSDGKPSDGEPSDGKPSDGQGGEPSDGQPSDGSAQPDQQQQQQPTERAASKLREAAERMEQARKKLEESERDGAVEEQKQALAELEQARAELEEVLRQLREEEKERTLTLLAARFRKMLDVQMTVYEGTQVLAAVAEKQRGHREQIEAGRLSSLEAKLVVEADKALLLLREEGSSVAFPEMVEMMRDDMQQVTQWLADVEVGELTQAIEQEIIESLEELIAALEQELRELDENRPPPGQGQPGPPPEMALVNQLTELKLIRSQQERIYRRTKRYGGMIEGERAEASELLEALAELAERQQRIYRATKDLATGRND
jgi:hypothetical protein